MTKIDIFSGFLGAGKTTLIKKLIKEAYKGEKLVLIENEFGEIGIDGGFLKDAGVEINEMNSGCICCSLVGDFAEALKKVLDEYNPDRILIEPSGVGKLSDVIKAVKGIDACDVQLGAFTTVVDANKCKMYMKNFGEFFNDQIESASTIILSHTANMAEDKINTCVNLLREHNKDAVIVTTDWDMLEGEKIVEAMEHKNTLQAELEKLKHEHHHEHHHDEHCDCGCHEHEHHEHHHDEHCDCGCHDHEHHEHHHHDEHCDCGCHDHEHHHHHADDVFQSVGFETTHKYSKEDIQKILEALEDKDKYGFVLRAKGIVESTDGSWIHFDYIPASPDVRCGGADVTGRLCVIGSEINKDEIKALFDIQGE